MIGSERRATRPGQPSSAARAEVTIVPAAQGIATSIARVLTRRRPNHDIASPPAAIRSMGIARSLLCRPSPAMADCRSERLGCRCSAGSCAARRNARPRFGERACDRNRQPTVAPEGVPDVAVPRRRGLGRPAAAVGGVPARAAARPHDRGRGGQGVGRDGARARGVLAGRTVGAGGDAHRARSPDPQHRNRGGEPSRAGRGRRAGGPPQSSTWSPG